MQGFKPGMDMMAFQKQIKDNSTDLQAMVTDLADWSEQITKTDTNIKKGGAVAGQAKMPGVRGAAAASSKPLPPIRNRIDISSSLKESQKKAPAGQSGKQRSAAETELLDKVKRDTTPMPDYYKAWDKIGRDLEEASDSDENDTGDANRAKNPKFKDAEGRSQADMFKPTSGARPNT